MKVISKKFVLQHGGDILLKREISIHRNLLHPNIIQLFDNFEDDKNVYLIMEYAENGNLYKQMKKQGKFSEKEAFNIFSQTCIGVDFLHKNKIIHRDLKPENLLIDKRKRIKVCDFGWSAETNDQYRYTFCGTVDYMAPEVILCKAHSYTVDVWCLGILLYELLHGKTPYHGSSQNEKMENIRKNVTIEFSDKLTPDCKHLIKSLLTFEESQRPGMEFIFSHPWIKNYENQFGINLSTIRNSYQRIRSGSMEVRPSDANNKGSIIKPGDSFGGQDARKK